MAVVPTDQERRSRAGQGLEQLLWSSRLLVLVAVLASLLIAVGSFYMAAVDVAYLAAKIGKYADPALAIDARAELRSTIVTGIVKAVDACLIGGIMVIFALGLYELFVGPIKAAESPTGARLLEIRDLDELKNRLAKVIILLLVVEFFQQALRLTFATPLDLLYLAIGILLIGGAVFLSTPHARPQ